MSTPFRCPILTGLVVLLLCGLMDAAVSAADVAARAETKWLDFGIAVDGSYAHFLHKQTKHDYCARGANVPRPRVLIAGREHVATRIVGKGNRVELTFGDSGAKATLALDPHERYLVVEVKDVQGEGVERFTFVDVMLKSGAETSESFVACALALNLQTNVTQIPQPTRRLRAMCYARFGFAGARVALAASPPGELRKVLQEVVTDAPDLPKSNIGGPWAMDAKINRGSYLFNFGGLNEQTADAWIKLAKDLGINQIDFHGGRSFRFGDCRPNPKTYPKGFASLKATIDKLHAAGIKAGLHTYAFFIAKDCPWVTPKPDPRLGKFRSFTLAEPIAADATTLTVNEPTSDVSTTTGFFVRNSVTLMIDEELVTFGGVKKGRPYAFTGCKRGACGTNPAAHSAGAKAHHLKECFGLFSPDGEGTLLTEVAAKTAEAYNTCGFDMIYMDALDGEGILGGSENGWHYGSKYVYEVCRRLNKPAVMEMSTFHHHLWCVRTRMGAWDHPTRSHKKFIDIHAKANEVLAKQFLPGHLGWWAIKTWTGHQGEPTFSDDIEYLCCKCIGTGAGLSIMGIGPGQIERVPVYDRLARIIRQYENLRHREYFGEVIRATLREPGKDFHLYQDTAGKWRLRQMHYDKHKVCGLDDSSNTWSVENPHKAQPIKLRIEALFSVEPYDAKDGVVLLDPAEPDALPERAAAGGVKATLSRDTNVKRVGEASARLAVTADAKAKRNATWAKLGRTFEPVRNLSTQQGMGVWIHGDGQGALLNFQLTCPHHLARGIGEHYVDVDFEGWRYVELVEPEGERHADYAWPYGNAYAIYRETVKYAHVRGLCVWANNIPPGKAATVRLGPIKALPLRSVTLKHPSIAVGGGRIVFPVEMPTGSYLEFDSLRDCKLYGPNGSLKAEVKPTGDVPTLEQGRNEITFRCEGPKDVRPRARVTVISAGEPL